MAHKLRNYMLDREIIKQVSVAYKNKHQTNSNTDTHNYNSQKKRKTAREESIQSFDMSLLNEDLGSLIYKSGIIYLSSLQRANFLILFHYFIFFLHAS
jgi:hypothetical protein